MAFHLPKLIVLLLVVTIVTMVLSAGAQQSGQPIIFSSPQSDDAQSVTPLLAQPISPPSLPSTMQAPVSPFSYNNTPLDNFPVLPPANTSERQRMEKMLADRRNRSLITPEAIFGATTEESSRPAERDAPGQEKNQTQLEHYLDRENQSLTGLTNGWQNEQANSPWDLTHGQDRLNPFDSRHPDTMDAAQNLNRLFNRQQNGDAPQNQNGIVGWDAFSMPAPQTAEKPNLEQMAAMERFHQLLEPSTTPPSPSPQSAFFSAPKVSDPNFTQPAFVVDPAGASFTPLSSGIGKPAGLTPLPGITTHLSQPSAAPSWAPQSPPWVSQAPQPFAAPQWKF